MAIFVKYCYSSSMTTITVPYNFKPRSYQLNVFKAIDNGYKRILLRWSRRAGKDMTCWNVLVKMALQDVGLYFYTFPEYSQGKKVIWEGRVGETPNETKFLDFIPPGWAIKKHATEMKVELANGSIIRVVGTENFDSLMGTNPKGIVFSEYSLQNPAAWEYLQPILMQNKGWAIFNGTPRGKNHMYEMEATNAGDKDWYISEVQSLWPDLPNYYEIASREVIDAHRKQGYTEEMVEQEFGVSYVAGQKGAYYMDCINQARTENRIGSFPPNFNKPVDVYLDLGVTDDTVMWFRQTEGSKLTWIDYYENNTKDLVFYVRELKSKGYYYRAIYLPHDGKSHTIQTMFSNKELLTKLLQEVGIVCPVYVAPKPLSKQIPIMLVRERFPRFYFHEEGTSEGLKKLSLYHRQWDRATKSFRDYPAHDWCSHAADAIAVEAITANLHDDYLNVNITEYKTEFDPIDYEARNDYDR